MAIRKGDTFTRNGKTATVISAIFGYNAVKRGGPGGHGINFQITDHATGRTTGVHNLSETAFRAAWVR